MSTKARTTKRNKKARSAKKSTKRSTEARTTKRNKKARSAKKSTKRSTEARSTKRNTKAKSASARDSGAKKGARSSGVLKGGAAVGIEKGDKTVGRMKIGGEAGLESDYSGEFKEGGEDVFDSIKSGLKAAKKKISDIYD
jgi:hypothetical protein